MGGGGTGVAQIGGRGVAWIRVEQSTIEVDVEVDFGVDVKVEQSIGRRRSRGSDLKNSGTIQGTKGTYEKIQ